MNISKKIESLASKIIDGAGGNVALASSFGMVALRDRSRKIRTHWPYSLS
jgi:hypothetical protein